MVRIASSGTARAAAHLCGPGDQGTGYTIYSNAFLLVMVPHSIVTVSLATAMLPRLSAYAADSDLGGLARSVASTLRTAYALIIPFALLLPLIALDLSNVLIGYGAGRSSVQALAVSLALFAPGLVLFTTHYLMLRGFYALERNRTVFYVQCVIAATNIVLAVAFTREVSASGTAPGLVLAYAGSYLVGAVVSYSLLRRMLGGLETPVLVRFLVRLLLAAGVAAATRLGGEAGRGAGLGIGERSRRRQGAGGRRCSAITGLVDIAVFVGLARLMRITEVTSIIALLTARLRR